MDDPPAMQWVRKELGRGDPAAVLEAARAVGRFTSHEWTGDVDVPAAVILTMQDRLVPPQRQLKLAQAIPGATVHQINADHGACVDRPDLFVPALVDATESVARRARLVRT
jgi:pimeloyl-ACP methyl ester carboxylesterase